MVGETWLPAYDDDGLLVSWSKESEPYWTDDDRAYVTAWKAESHPGHGCGQPVEECTAIENSFAYKYEVIRCHALYAQHEALKAHQESNPDDQGATLTRLVRTPHGRV